jgi:hypothetical protein
MKLSKNLSLSEVVKSATAIKRGISNQPTKQHLQNLIKLAENVFQPLRNYIDKPIRVSSGYRSKELNKLIGGASRSQHSKGEALDLDNDRETNILMFNYIKDNLDFDQLINEQDYSWIHVSYREGSNRKQVLRMVNGKYFNYE